VPAVVSVVWPTVPLGAAVVVVVVVGAAVVVVVVVVDVVVVGAAVVVVVVVVDVVPITTLNVFINHVSVSILTKLLVLYRSVKAKILAAALSSTPAAPNAQTDPVVSLTKSNWLPIGNATELLVGIVILAPVPVILISLPASSNTRV
jgi:hypothetical protein